MGTAPKADPFIMIDLLSIGRHRINSEHLNLDVSPVESVLEEKWGLFRERKETRWRGSEDSSEIETILWRAAKMVQRLRALDTLAGDQGLIPSTHTEAHSHL